MGVQSALVWPVAEVEEWEAQAALEEGMVLEVLAAQ
jgi:hypothetical protein